MNTYIENFAHPAQPAEVGKKPNRILRALGATAAVAVLGTAAYGAITGENNDNAPATPETHKVYTVQPGDKLWNIAKSAAPDTDPREEIELIREQLPNHSVELTPGEELPLPANSKIGETVPGPFDNSGE